jgi:D-glycero-D-manno-heptose 1,7-bisphosphate phosphatase
MQNATRRRAVFLDRDGVLNEVVLKNGHPHSPMSPDQISFCSGAASACADLKQAGYLLIIVTNQPDVARGIQTRQMVERINEEVVRRLKIDDVRTCFHDDVDNCTCRKPKPGLLLEAANDWDIDLTTSFLVGDRSKDIGAGLSAGCMTFLINTPYNEYKADAHFIVTSLRAAADGILDSRS